MRTILFASLLSASLASAQDAPAEKPLLAVMPFDNHTHRDSAGMESADQFIRCLFKTGRYRLVHPVQSIKVLMNHTRGCIDVDERDAAQKIGKSLGCDVILIGDVRAIREAVPPAESPEGAQGMLFEISARLMDVGTGRTLWLSHMASQAQAKDPGFNRLEDAVSELAESLVEKFPGRPDPPPAVTPAR